MTRTEQRLAGLEAEVARLRADLDATRCVLELTWRDGFEHGRRSVSGYEAAAHATAPRSRGHLAVVGEFPRLAGGTA
jgi:hypothetical protein